MTAWDILTNNSTLPFGTAWQHLNNPKTISNIAQIGISLISTQETIKNIAQSAQLDTGIDKSTLSITAPKTGITL